MEEKNLSPEEIYDFLDHNIVGQKEAKKAVSLITWNALNGRRSANLIIGETGTGKTEMWRVLKEIFPQRIFIYDANMLGPPGWNGTCSILDMLKMDRVDGRIPVILVIDEFDKKCKPQCGAKGTDYAQMMQETFLRLTDGDEVATFINKEFWSVDGKNITLVFTGAWSKLHEQNKETPIGFGSAPAPDKKAQQVSIESIIDQGMIRELAGRISRIVYTKPLSKTAMVQIVKNTVHKLEKEYDSLIYINNASIQRIAANAMDANLGARYIRRELIHRIDKVQFSNPDTDAIYLDKTGERKNDRNAENRNYE